jgi:two-component system phosphate regulon sensor histidine kinase PhoR
MPQRLVHLLRRRIVVKLTLTLVAFVGVAGLAAGLYLDKALEAFARESLEGRLVMVGRLLLDDAPRWLLPTARREDVRDAVQRVRRSSGARATVIAADGRVVADSDVPMEEWAQIENHGARPEVRAALAGRVGTGMRRSATVREPLVYVALPVVDQGRIVGTLRLALPLSAVTSSYAALQRVMLIGGLVALAVAAAIGVFVSRRITEPIVEMQRVARRMTDGAPSTSWRISAAR